MPPAIIANGLGHLQSASPTKFVHSILGYRGEVIFDIKVDALKSDMKQLILNICKGETVGSREILTFTALYEFNSKLERKVMDCFIHTDKFSRSSIIMQEYCRIFSFSTLPVADEDEESEFIVVTDVALTNITQLYTTVSIL
jgi:hypothetical protein